jgi:hypothetical protein
MACVDICAGLLLHLLFSLFLCPLIALLVLALNVIPGSINLLPSGG